MPIHEGRNGKQLEKQFLVRIAKLSACRAQPGGSLYTAA
jgi:hypothetical protein